MPESTTPPSDPQSPRLPPVTKFDDHTTLWLLEDPIQLRGLIQILDPGLADRLDFTHASRINRSFIPADLQEKESDLIFEVPFLGEQDVEVWVYILLEHKSEPEAEVGLQLYLYMGEIWDTQRREWTDRRTPPLERRLRPIVPLVFYTGERRWSVPIGLTALMDLPAELERFVPRWETLFLSVHGTSAEALTQFGSAIGWALRVWQAERAPAAELERVLREAMAGLEGLTEEQAGQWLRVAWFFLLLVLYRRDERELTELVIQQARTSGFAAREEVDRMGQTVAEQLRAEGAAHYARTALETVLATKFGRVPEEVRQALVSANLASLDAWLLRAATAATLDEVGIMPPQSDTPR